MKSRRLFVDVTKSERRRSEIVILVESWIIASKAFTPYSALRYLFHLSFLDASSHLCKRVGGSLGRSFGPSRYRQKHFEQINAGTAPSTTTADFASSAIDETNCRRHGTMTSRNVGRICFVSPRIST